MTTTKRIPPNIYLIRHGETKWALTGRHTGRTDIPLTTHGEDEVRELGTHLRGIPFTHVLTSPLQRAKYSCDLAGLDTAAESEPDLMEWDYGDYEGKISRDIRMERADWNIFQHGCPHGEMPAQIEERADRLIVRLRTMSGNVAIFTHGHFGSALAARWIGLSLIEARHFPLATASLSILSFDPKHPAIPVIALWNAAANKLFDTARCLPAGETTTAPGSIEEWENEGGEIPPVT